MVNPVGFDDQKTVLSRIKQNFAPTCVPQSQKTIMVCFEQGKSNTYRVMELAHNNHKTLHPGLFLYVISATDVTIPVLLNELGLLFGIMAAAVRFVLLSDNEVTVFPNIERENRKKRKTILTRSLEV